MWHTLQNNQPGIHRNLNKPKSCIRQTLNLLMVSPLDRSNFIYLKHV